MLGEELRRFGRWNEMRGLLELLSEVEALSMESFSMDSDMDLAIERAELLKGVSTARMAGVEEKKKCHPLRTLASRSGRTPVLVRLFSPFLIPSLQSSQSEYYLGLIGHFFHRLIERQVRA